MSRSRRKKPIFGITKAASEKAYKRISHKQMRAWLRTMLAKCTNPEDFPVLVPKQFGNPYVGPKDGKIFWRNAEKLDLVK